MAPSTANTTVIALPPTTAHLDIAIAGAGIGGLAAAIALRKHPKVRVTIYEQATELREIGASIALGPNGLRTLEKLGVENALTDEVCFRGSSKFPMIYRHWKTNEIVSRDVHHTVTDHKHQTARFHRAHLHQALLANVPPEIVHLKKKVVGVEAGAETGVTISFADGTQAKADFLLGADGIHSNVRKIFVPDHTLHWTGWVALRSTFDAKLIEGIPDVPEDSAHWWGPDRTFFASRLGKGQYTIVGGYDADPLDPNAPYRDAQWNGPGDKAILRKYYQDWHPCIRALIEASPYTRLYPNVAGAPIDRWTFGGGRVTLLGDAAHTHGGAFAAGGSLAIQDAYAFALALRQVFPYDAAARPTPETLARASTLYEETRKPQANRILKLVHELIGKQKERVRRAQVETDEELRARMINRPDPWWISEHDVEKAFQETVRRLDGKAPEVLARL